VADKPNEHGGGCPAGLERVHRPVPVARHRNVPVRLAAWCWFVLKKILLASC
jgi:hypothetical protein